METSFFAKKRNVTFVAVIYTFLWGSAFPLVKLCMESFGIPPNDNMSMCLLAGIRFVLSGGITLLWTMLYYEKSAALNVAELKYGLLYGIAGTLLQYGFTYVGLSSLEGSKGAIYDQLSVFLIVLTSGIFFKSDRLTPKKIAGCVLGFAGVCVTSTQGLDFEFSLNADGLMIVAAICQSTAYFIAKFSSDKVSAPKLVGLGQLNGGIMLCTFSLLCGGTISHINTTAVLTLLTLVIISAVAFVLSLMPLKYFEASEVSSFNLLITVFGVIMSSLVLGENILKPNYLVATILVCTGIITINLRRNNHVEHI